MTINVELLDAVLGQIEAHPETWDQSQWRCGTSFCFAGHAALMDGWKLTEGRSERFVWDLSGYDSYEDAVRIISERYDSSTWMDSKEREDLKSLRIEELSKLIPLTNTEVYRSDQTRTIESAAVASLGITIEDADVLFEASNTLKDLRIYVRELKENGDLDAFKGEDSYEDYCCEACNEC